jgi:hypothetical protein
MRWMWPRSPVAHTLRVATHCIARALQLGHTCLRSDITIATATEPMPSPTTPIAAVNTHTYAAFSSDSSAPSLFQSHSMQRSRIPRLFSFFSTNFAWHTGHGCGMGLSHATKSQPFFAQFEQP